MTPAKILANNDLNDLLHDVEDETGFTVIVLREVWSINKTYNLTGFSQLLYRTLDVNTEPNQNSGGGVIFYVNSKLKNK